MSIRHALKLAELDRDIEYITNRWFPQFVGKKRYEQKQPFFELRMMDYQDYLKTEHWQMVREIKLEQAENRCQVCDSSGPLDVHHRSYRRMGTEGELNDTIVLCRHCHEVHHGMTI